MSTMSSLEERLARFDRIAKQESIYSRFGIVSAVFSDDGSDPDIELIQAIPASDAEELLYRALWARDEGMKKKKGLKGERIPAGLLRDDTFGRVVSALTHNLEQSKVPVQRLPYERLYNIYARALKAGNPYDLNMSLYKRVLAESVHDEKKHADPEHRTRVMSSLPEVQPDDLLYAICPLRREEGDGIPDQEVLDAVPAELAGKLFERAINMKYAAEKREFDRSFFNGMFRHVPFWGFMSALTHHLERIQCPARFLEEEHLEEIYTPARKNGNPHNLNMDLFRRVFLELGRIGEPMNPEHYDDYKHFVLSSYKELVLENMETATIHDILYAFGPYLEDDHADLELIGAMPLDKTLAMFNEATKHCQTDKVFNRLQTDDLVGALTDRLEELECPVEMLDFDMMHGLYEDEDASGDLNRALYERVFNAKVKSDGGALLLELLAGHEHREAIKFLRAVEDSDISMKVRAQIGQFFITFMRKHPDAETMLGEIRFEHSR